MIPAGMTGTLQPLDVRINGEINARVTGAANKLISQNESWEKNVVNAVLFELGAWRAITRRNIIKSWAPLVGEESVQ
jgi:hypothetical protein